MVRENGRLAASMETRARPRGSGIQGEDLAPAFSRNGEVGLTACLQYQLWHLTLIQLLSPEPRVPLRHHLINSQTMPGNR